MYKLLLLVKQCTSRPWLPLFWSLSSINCVSIVKVQRSPLFTLATTEDQQPPLSAFVWGVSPCASRCVHDILRYWLLMRCHVQINHWKDIYRHKRKHFLCSSNAPPPLPTPNIGEPCRMQLLTATATDGYNLSATHNQTGGRAKCRQTVLGSFRLATSHFTFIVLFYHDVKWSLRQEP